MYNSGSKSDKGVIGPQMPENLKKRKLSEHSESETDGKKSKRKKDGIGPQLPAHLMKSTKNDESSDSSSDSHDDEDDDVIGPQLPGAASQGGDESSVAADIQMRAEKMKNKLLGKDEEKPMTRESWMTELPDKLGSSLGMPVAKSRFGDGKKDTGDKRGWTETPQQREERLAKGISDAQDKFEYKADARDEQMLAATEQLQTDRPESLLDLHRKKLEIKQQKREKKKRRKERKKEKRQKNKDGEEKKSKKKDKKSRKKSKKDSSPKAARRPFDRDLDLKANVFDDAKKNALIKRSAQLNTRFTSSGTQGQFL